MQLCLIVLLPGPFAEKECLSSAASPSSKRPARPRAVATKVDPIGYIFGAGNLSCDMWALIFAMPPSQVAIEHIGPSKIDLAERPAG